MWLEPKTDWQTADVVSKDDFNRIEGNAQHLKDTKVDKTEFNLHVNNKNNPHNVTAAQVGAAPSSHTHDNRYYTESEMDTKIAAKVDKPASAVSGNIAVFDGGAGKLKDSGKKPEDFMNGIEKRGNAYYTDAVSAGATITKNIALGSSYKHGIVLIHSSTYITGYGLLAFISTSANNTLVITGYYDSGLRNVVAYRADEDSDFTNTYVGRSVADDGNPPAIFITSIYLNGTNLTITFKNRDTATKNLKCRVNWEVW